MGRQKNKLTAIEVRTAKPGKLMDGGGLILDKTSDGGKWIYRYSFAGNRRAMGLGSLASTSLSDARKARDKWATVLQDGKDPISERNRLRDAERAEASRTDPTLEEVAAEVFEAKKAGLRGGGERGRWFSPVARHILPKLGRRRISQIHQSDIRDTLAPIWKTKHPTAEKAIQRLGIIFRHAKLSGYDCDPFTVDAARHMLGEVRHVEVPIPATPWQEIPALFQRLNSLASSVQCLRMMILTAVRSEGVRGMLFSEVDYEARVWTVPAERMKGQEGQAKPFRVPLSDAAMEVLRVRAELAENDRVFPSNRRGQSISAEALGHKLDDMKEAGRPHGFRTSFKTWVQDTEACSFDVCETVLSHQIGNKVERAYGRSDLLDRRRDVMDKWARFVTACEIQEDCRHAAE